MSSLLAMPLSETKSISGGISLRSLWLLFISTEKSLRLRLFTPMIRAPAFKAIFISSSLCTSTKADKPRVLQILRYSLICFSFKIEQIKSIADAFSTFAS